MIRLVLGTNLKSLGQISAAVGQIVGLLTTLIALHEANH
jgi:hypothetical protein